MSRQLTCLAGKARKGRKEQTDTVVSTLTSSITKKKQIVSQKIKRGLPGLVSRGMEDGGEGHGDQAGWVGVTRDG